MGTGIYIVKIVKKIILTKTDLLSKCIPKHIPSITAR